MNETEAEDCGYFVSHTLLCSFNEQIQGHGWISVLKVIHPGVNICLHRGEITGKQEKYYPKLAAEDIKHGLIPCE